MSTAWLPVGFTPLPEFTTRKLLSHGETWQIWQGQAKPQLLLATAKQAKQWAAWGLIDAEHFQTVPGKGGELVGALIPHGLVGLVGNLERPSDVRDAEALFHALKRSQKLLPDGVFADGLYVEAWAIVLPIDVGGIGESADLIVGSYLTGGVPIPLENTRRLSVLSPWLQAKDFARLRKIAGVEEKTGNNKTSEIKGDFSLAGRPELGTFFQEHIVDVVNNAERYEKLGLGFPAGIILYGPPGCGKTYAVEQLAKYLDWPTFRIDSNSVASPYIHETSRKISEVFEQAISQSPAMIIIDEMEAYLGTREGAHKHGVEETAEFLRRLTEAPKNKVLVIGMTNRLQDLDPAIVRRGRFDHQIEVTWPSQEEVLNLLKSILEGKPHEKDLPLEAFAKQLAGRALSDADFVMREAARLSARAGEDQFTKSAFEAAIASLPNANDQPKNKIGFI